MGQSTSWECSRSQSCQEIPRMLWTTLCSIQHSQECATFPYPEPAQSLIFHLSKSLISFPLLLLYQRKSPRLRNCEVSGKVLRWETWNGSPCVSSGAPVVGYEEIRFSLLDSVLNKSAFLSRAHRWQNKHCSQRVTFCFQLTVLRRQLNTSHLPGIELLIKINLYSVSQSLSHKLLLVISHP